MTLSLVNPVGVWHLAERDGSPPKNMVGQVDAWWRPVWGLVLRPRLDVQALGERSDFTGDLRLPADELPDFPRVLAGEAELTVRPSVNGRWRVADAGGWEAELSWDLGVSFIRDAGHVAGDDRTEFVGVVSATVRTPRLTVTLD